MNLFAHFLSRKVLVLHVFFWVLYFSYKVYDIAEYVGVTRALIYVSLPMTCNIAASYLHYFLVLPLWIHRKKVKAYLLWLALLIAVVVTIRILIENQVFSSLIKTENYYATVKITRIISTVWDTLAFMIFTGMLRFTLERFDLENKQRQLENEKLVAELNYLKAQINPHFLFNTLHNLNYLVYAASARATEVIIKLSNIMRYMIYDANRERVPLQKEIDYIKDYIDLESIRLNNIFKMAFDVKGDVSSVEVAPLMMITFLENAFKHGVSDSIEDCWIKANIRVADGTLKFHVSNSKLPPRDHQKLKSGFGLENVRKRLQLSYPGKHVLDIREDEKTFTVNLSLASL